MEYPIVTAPVANWPMQCIYTHKPIEAGQPVALSPIGLISLVSIQHQSDEKPISAEAVSFGYAVLVAYAQRQCILLPTEQVIRQINQQMLTELIATIPANENRYLYQLFYRIDLKPYFLALKNPPPS